MTTSVTYHEIISQTNAWQAAVTAVSQQTQALQDLWQSDSFDQVIFTGCGSTYYLSLAAASLLQSLTGHACRAVPGGELVLYPETAFTSNSAGKTVLVALSRSGTTTETVTAVTQFKAAHRGPVVVITNYGHSPLAQLADITITIEEGQEESVAQTRSFASMYVATTAVACCLAGEDAALAAMTALPAIGDRFIQQYEPVAQKWGEDLGLDRFYFLGSGPRYGLACEVNLKMKEMTLTHSEPFHFMEFRHGPMSMVNESAAVIGLLSEVQHKHETAVLQEMTQLGGHVLALGEADADVVFASGLPEMVRNVLYLPILQLMAYYRAVAKGLNPDRPHNLTAVIELDLAL